jgi:hypothetical protein
MKRKNAKGILGFLALVFGMMLVGCGGDGSDETSYTPPSTPTSPTTPTIPTKPVLRAPTGLVVTSNVNGEIGLQWDSVTGATGYWVEYTGGSINYWKRAGELVTNRITVTNLTAGTIYDFRVSAYTTDPLYLSNSDPYIVFSGYAMLTGIKVNGRGRP